ncbi:beta-lactamase domain protein [Pseudopedobacter saltans DSM 12145]|uniref:Beta-lactamase domain protein n=1 Tax=Pseudopedobacter saltans (strain ATCC 51119 / DSM 12145 / JCM 21818 / CCUG 39354 / LMG 10337 / NBRC 100064 / NCIMB 13643) TaxID=762903 RepID=F0S9L7_PSESL|nr:MBL fold metallo-hydrolase [Pseudopedobacter saltans]ADY53570.1 beta-lactamase domain protein [Pseudopedobacter saltans DSM 12145]
MLKLQQFVNNPYQENTYVLSDETGSCVIIDPGMYNATEQNAVVNYIKENNLKPEILLNTHCHIDHVLGNKFVFDIYGLRPQIHKGELQLLHAVPSYAPQQGFNYEISPEPEAFLTEEDTVKFGNSILKIIFAPGHSPAHLCFYHEESKTLIGGDVLFYGSIGRTDLPGGNFETLISSIKNNLFILPDDTKVYPGHGPATTIGFEKANNPFLR